MITRENNVDGGTVNSLQPDVLTNQSQKYYDPKEKNEGAKHSHKSQEQQPVKRKKPFLL
jgi:hypothetical protein